MKLKLCFSLCIALLAALASDAALARSRTYVGVYMGPPPVYVGPPSMFWGARLVPFALVLPSAGCGRTPGSAATSAGLHRAT